MKKTLILLLLACACTAKNPVLTVEGGQIQGVETETSGVIVYRGIPFATRLNSSSTVIPSSARTAST